MTSAGVPTLIWDLDNTLCRCGEYYHAAEDQLVALVCEATALPPEYVRALFHRIDLHATTLADGWMAHRFPSAMAATAATASLLTSKGRPVDPELVERARAIGAAVFEAPYPLYEGADAVLEQCAQAGWRQVLYTKGDPGVQFNKFYRNKLYRYFIDRAVVVTPQKTLETLQELVTQQRVDVKRSWYIGDSMRDDIIPAATLGLRTVWVSSADGHHSYEHGALPVRPTATVNSVTEAGDVLSAYYALFARKGGLHEVA